MAGRPGRSGSQLTRTHLRRQLLEHRDDALRTCELLWSLRPCTGGSAACSMRGASAPLADMRLGAGRLQPWDMSGLRPECLIPRQPLVSCSGSESLPLDTPLLDRCAKWSQADFSDAAPQLGGARAAERLPPSSLAVVMLQGYSPTDQL